MLQIFSTNNESRVRGLKSHQREVGGWFRSSLHRITFALEILNLHIFWNYRQQLKRGSEQSTNFRWWDLASYSGFIQSREDLKHPPTAVGGIWTFCAKPHLLLRFDPVYLWLIHAINNPRRPRRLSC